MYQIAKLNFRVFEAPVRTASIALATILCWGIVQREASATWLVVPVEIANSQTDWDVALATGTPGVPDQGALGWEYGFFDVDDDPTSFTLLQAFSGTNWIPGPGQKTGGSPNNPRIDRDSTHPGFDGSLADRWTARRWTSSVDDEVRIFGTAQRNQDGGDGLFLRFYLNGTELSSEALFIPGGSDNTLWSFDFTTLLETGDVLDFVADRNGTPFFDNLLFQVQMTRDVFIPEPTTFSLVALGTLLIPRRRRAHRGPAQRI